MASSRAFENIIKAVRDDIEAKRLRPGDKLPAERELAVKFGVGRNAVREALRTLESAGLIKLQKGVNGGSFVREGSYEGVTQSFRDMLALGRITLDDMTSARQDIMRIVLEHAAKKATKEDFEKIRINIDRSEIATRDKQYGEQLKLTEEFYRLLAESTKNYVLVLIILPLSEVVRRFVVAANIPPPRNVINSRRRTLECLMAGDAQGAIEAVNTHLEIVHQSIRKRFPESELPAVEDPQASEK
ncbi:MAG: FadR family transcriptional regulator [Rhodobiaceae bacterium]|nr:FadR family transcriptional regulator [Rhodobiaceae bacterium]MCC0056201.1 FadR family transcriptional regulator [Rhodobiaceae bacterium]